MLFFFFFSAPAIAEIYTLSLHDALPISVRPKMNLRLIVHLDRQGTNESERSEEHTSELQSQFQLVCRLLLEKKNRDTPRPIPRSIAPPPPRAKSPSPRARPACR